MLTWTSSKVTNLIFNPKIRLLKQNQLVTWAHWSGFLLLESSISTGVNRIKRLCLSVNLKWENHSSLECHFTYKITILIYIWENFKAHFVFWSVHIHHMNKKILVTWNCFVFWGYWMLESDCLTSIIRCAVILRETHGESKVQAGHDVSISRRQKRSLQHTTAKETKPTTK